MTENLPLQAKAEQHLPLVSMLAMRFPYAQLRDDLFQQGVVGLMKALQRFDTNRGTSFSTYAVPFILGEMRQLLRQEAPLHLSRAEQTLRLKIRRTEVQLVHQLHRDPTITELAETLQIPADELVLHMESIAVTSTDDEEHLTLLPSPDNWQQRIELQDILAKLPPMDQKLILLRHRTGMTQAQAGQRLGMTQMQISRREKIIRSLLKRALTE